MVKSRKWMGRPAVKCSAGSGDPRRARGAAQYSAVKVLGPCQLSVDGCRLAACLPIRGVQRLTAGEQQGAAPPPAPPPRAGACGKYPAEHRSIWRGEHAHSRDDSIEVRKCPFRWIARSLSGCVVGLAGRELLVEPSKRSNSIGPGIRRDAGGTCGRSGRSEKCLPWPMAEGGRPITIRGCNSGRRGSTGCCFGEEGDCPLAGVSATLRLRRSVLAPQEPQLLAMT